MKSDRWSALRRIPRGLCARWPRCKSRRLRGPTFGSNVSPDPHQARVPPAQKAREDARGSALFGWLSSEKHEKEPPLAACAGGGVLAPTVCTGRVLPIEVATLRCR